MRVTLLPQCRAGSHAINQSIYQSQSITISLNPID
eukprot:COSAG06_NODE_70527_length_191_cov_74.206522_1_plen_34_part_01